MHNTKRLRESESVQEFLRYLKTLVDQLEVSGCCMNAPLPQAYYQMVVDDLSLVGWDK